MKTNISQRPVCHLFQPSRDRPTCPALARMFGTGQTVAARMGIMGRMVTAC